MVCVLLYTVIVIVICIAVSVLYIENSGINEEWLPPLYGATDQQERRELPVIVKISDFMQKMKKKEQWDSGLFFLYETEYEVCLTVYPGGYEDGDDSHLSVYLYIMKSNDDKSKRPLKGTFVIEILDQLLRNEDHYSHSTKVDGTTVLEYPHFISHDVLFHHANYLIKDTIYIRITYKEMTFSDLFIELMVELYYWASDILTWVTAGLYHICNPLIWLIAEVYYNTFFTWICYLISFPIWVLGPELVLSLSLLMFSEASGHLSEWEQCVLLIVRTIRRRIGIIPIVSCLLFVFFLVGVVVMGTMLRALFWGLLTIALWVGPFIIYGEVILKNLKESDIVERLVDLVKGNVIILVVVIVFLEDYLARVIVYIVARVIVFIITAIFEIVQGYFL